MIKYMDEKLLIKKGTAILLKELGPAEALRFIRLPSRKREESVKRHRRWQEKLDKDEFFNAVFGSED